MCQKQSINITRVKLCNRSFPNYCRNFLRVAMPLDGKFHLLGVKHKQDTVNSITLTIRQMSFNKLEYVVSSC